MRVKVHILALAAFLCAFASGAPDAAAAPAAKPTHRMARESSRSVVAPVSARGRRASRRHSLAAARAAVRRSRRRTHAKTAIAAHAERVSARRKLETPADAATIERVHAWELAQRKITRDEEASATEPRLSVSADVTASPLMLPSLHPIIYDGRGHLIVPAPLYGSHEVLVHQNEMADRDGLTRIEDDADLLNLRREHKLVPLPESETLRVDDRLPANRRFSRPWTSAFLTAFSRDFYSVFHEPLQVNSAVRTVEFQQHLEHINGNAAPSEGDTASPHLTGQAVDIAKHGLTLAEIAWVRAYLQPLMLAGVIDVEEEFQQACFHISVYRGYLPSPGRSVAVRTTAHPGSSAE